MPQTVSHRPRVLVTGASKGIGRAIADRLSRDGYDVVGVARHAPDRMTPGQTFHSVDLEDLECARDKLTRLARERPFYALVNNASAASMAPLAEAGLNDLRLLMKLNVEAALVCCQAVIDGMRAAGTGRIVNVSSRAALGRQGRTAYAAAKAAVIGMTRTWALELAPHGITVNAIAPGPVETEMFEREFPPGSVQAERIVAEIPVKRFGRTAEIAHAVAFLLDRDAGYMTGQVLHVDGGLSVGKVSA